MDQRVRIRLLQFGSLAVAVPILLSQPAWHDEASKFLKIIGILLIFICISGRLWSILYIGSSKNQRLISHGPYSTTRNPLYLFSTVGAFGVGLVFSSLVFAFALGLLSYLAFYITARKEAEYLRTVFGSEYEVYAKRTPIFWPDPSKYRDQTEITFSPAGLRRSFLDGLLFFLALPVAELVLRLHEWGMLPTLLRVY